MPKQKKQAKQRRIDKQLITNQYDNQKKLMTNNKNHKY